MKETWRVTINTKDAEYFVIVDKKPSKRQLRLGSFRTLLFTSTHGVQLVIPARDVRVIAVTLEDDGSRV